MQQEVNLFRLNSTNQRVEFLNGLLISLISGSIMATNTQLLRSENTMYCRRRNLDDKRITTATLNPTDVVLFFELQNMPFRFFALNCWQLTSFCNIHRLENPKAKGIVWLQIYFCSKNAQKKIPPKRFSKHTSSKFITARK